jgi:Iodothyronine deiodinase
LGALEALRDRYRDRVAFLVVYIREAHPEDGWVLESNRREGIALADPALPGERAGAAEACAVHLRITMPVLVDGLDDEVARRYGAWPDRLYLIGADGTAVSPSRAARARSASSPGFSRPRSRPNSTRGG